jgi:hypothetical protein
MIIDILSTLALMETDVWTLPIIHSVGSVQMFESEAHVIICMMVNAFAF